MRYLVEVALEVDRELTQDELETHAKLILDLLVVYQPISVSIAEVK